MDLHKIESHLLEELKWFPQIVISYSPCLLVGELEKEFKLFKLSQMPLPPKTATDWKEETWAYLQGAGAGRRRLGLSELP